jgi:putative chitinase
MGIFDSFTSIFSSPAPAPIAPVAPIEAPAPDPTPDPAPDPDPTPEPAPASDVAPSQLVTTAQLQQIMTYAGSRIPMFIDFLNAGMAEFEINTLYRVWMFIAQISEESGELRYTLELASGQEYEGRADLGNTQPGDGARFKGRGLIQITGRSNYAAAGIGLGLDLINQPELLQTPENATRSACWWWNKHGLNALADAGEFTLITQRINGGTNGLAERQAYLAKAQAAIPML